MTLVFCLFFYYFRYLLSSLSVRYFKVSWLCASRGYKNNSLFSSLLIFLFLEGINN